VSGTRAAVLVMAASQAPPLQRQVRAAVATGDSSCGVAERPESVSLLFSDSCGGAAHLTAPVVLTAAGGAEAPAAVVKRWQPHDGRRAPQLLQVRGTKSVFMHLHLPCLCVFPAS
jgi:hypothetical protein